MGEQVQAAQGGDAMDKLRQAVSSKSVDGKIACRVALSLADEFGVPPGKVGEVANQLKVKIAGCQLGCFR